MLQINRRFTDGRTERNNDTCGTGNTQGGAGGAGLRGDVGSDYDEGQLEQRPERAAGCNEEPKHYRRELRENAWRAGSLVPPCHRSVPHLPAAGHHRDSAQNRIELVPALLCVYTFRLYLWMLPPALLSELLQRHQAPLSLLSQRNRRRPSTVERPRDPTETVT